MKSVSVVICTYNRAHTISETLRSLRNQVYINFNVIVVMGPCTDGTEKILSDNADWITVYRTNLRNLSISRNIGIEAATGEIVAFIDDDAIADPKWLMELVEQYDDPSVGGVGGLVYDHTGVELQYRFSACYRRGETTYKISPPFDNFVVPGADPFLYIQGTNASFLTDALKEIGGFNEDIEYYHDETDVCMRIIDRGFKIVSLEKASVIHKYAPSHIRNHNRLVLDPYTTVKNQHLFALQNGRYSQSTRSLHSYLAYYTSMVSEGARWNFRHGNMTAAQLEYFMARMEMGVLDGVKAGDRPRNSRAFQTSAPIAKQFSAVEPINSNPLNIVFVSQEYPPFKIGGIGRFTRDLAEELARQGHVVHVITQGENATIDYANGVYIHTIEYLKPSPEVLSITPAAWNIAHQFSIYNYLLKLEARFSIDIVSAPIWLCEGLIVHLAKRWPNVLTLHTTMKTIVDLHPEEAAKPENKALIALEGLAFQSAQFVQANSNSVLDKALNDYHDRDDFYIIPHGIPELQPFEHANQVSIDTNILSGLIKVLFVGRVELRKGVDILLEAISELFPVRENSRWPDIQFIIAGPRSLNTGFGISFEEWFGNERPDLVFSKRVVFLGELTEVELAYIYHVSDIFVLPSRFESFGIVLLEALRAGLPVISANTSGMSEIVRPEFGMLFAPNNSGDLASKLAELAESPDKIATMSASALRAIQEVYNIETIASSVLKKYREAIGMHKLQDKFGIDQDSISFAFKISQALNVSIWDARKICESFLPGVDLKLKMERLSDILINGSNKQFFDTCYLTFLGRPYEKYVDEKIAGSAIAASMGRLGFASKLLLSEEAARLTAWNDMKKFWYKLVGENDVEHL